MNRWLLMFTLLCFTACSGTLDVGDEAADEQTTTSTPSPATQPADSATPSGQSPASTQSPQTETDEPEPQPQMQAEPEPEPEPDPEPEPEPTLPEPGSIVEFQIAQGTGNGAWNSPDNPVVVYVGQVLKLTNFDDRDHQMHATDDAPVPHGNRIRPGQSEEYVVDSPLVVGDSAEMWDHGDGRSASFWVEAREYPDP